MTPPMRQISLFRFGGATQHLASVNSGSFFQAPSCPNTCIQANRQDNFRNYRRRIGLLPTFYGSNKSAALLALLTWHSYTRCVAGRELFHRPGKQTTRQLLSGLRARVLLRNSTGILKFLHNCCSSIPFLQDPGPCN